MNDCRFNAPGDLHPSNPLPGDFKNLRNSFFMMDTQTGLVQLVSVLDRGDSIIDLYGERVRVHEYKLVGPFAGDTVWIDQQQRPVMFRMIDGGSSITFGLIR